MKILLDINITPKWRVPLEAIGCEVRHWSQIGDPSAPDSELMEWARQNGFVIFTNDLDYGALLYHARARKPSVIQLRGDDVRPGALSAIVAKAIAESREELAAGALITIDWRRSRISVLPLGSLT